MFDVDMVIGLTFTLVLIAMIGGFILLFPVARQLAKYLDRRLGAPAAEPGAQPALRAEVQRLGAAVEALQAEVERLAERQAFTDSLLTDREKRAIEA